jgi:glycosyltransferase involved in cell wall biosynthesis
MKIAFFSTTPMDSTLGATKNRIELADALENIGWETQLVSHEMLGLKDLKYSALSFMDAYREAFKDYLLINAHLYDVVLYEYDSLPFPRSLFNKETVFVARAALLYHHFVTTKIPTTLKAKLQSLLTISSVKKFRVKERKIKDETFRQADVIQVQNLVDKGILIKNGFSEFKIYKVPNGISDSRRALFNKIVRNYTSNPKVAFVGTFDFRKGAIDFPKIVARVLKEIPTCKFKLMGVKGFYQTEKQILNSFPKALWPSLEIIMTFKPDDLPGMLSECHVGMFPSYIESFGFGVLEMMAAGLPVVSYDAPGPSDFVPLELQVRKGNYKEMAEKIVQTLNNNELPKIGEQSKKLSMNYNWADIGIAASNTYKDYLDRLKSQQTH